MIDPYVAEFIGTFFLLLLGAGVVANVTLKNTIAEGQSPWVLITSAWGFAVFVGVFITGQFSGDTSILPLPLVWLLQVSFLGLGSGLYHCPNFGSHDGRLGMLSHLY